MAQISPTIRQRLAGAGVLNERATRRLAVAIAAAHLLLALLYSVTIPPWEGLDEWAHYKYAEHIARHRALVDPTQRLTVEPWAPQATQPPLYYLLAAAAIAPVLPADGYTPQLNPYALFSQQGRGIGGVNFAVHDPAAERFPWRGTVLALHLARLVSVLIGTLALWPTFALARLVLPGAPAVALGALGLQAFLPQYVYLGSIVHNDILTVALGGVVLYLSARIAFGAWRLRQLALLAAAVGLLIWTKNTGFALLPLALAALLTGGIRRARLQQLPRRRLLITGAGALALLALGVGGWAGYNLLTTGQLLPRFSNFPIQHILDWLAGRPSFAPILLWDILPSAWGNLLITFWAAFGHENITSFAWLYPAANGLALLALAGVLLALAVPRGGAGRGPLLLLIGAAASALLLTLYRVLLFGGGMTGRYLFVALPALAVLCALGLHRLWPAGAGRLAPGAVALALALVSAATLRAHIAPAYAPPAPLTAHDIPATAHPVQARLGEAVELVAYELAPGELLPGQPLRVSLYLRVLDRLPANYTLGIHLLGPALEDYGMRNTYPGEGNYATSIWQPGVLFRETAWITAQPTGPLPSLGQVSLALFPYETPLAGMPAFDGDGQPLGGSILFGRLRLSPREPPPAPPLAEPVDYAFGPEQNIRLRSAAITPAGRAPIAATLTLTLTWECVTPLAGGADAHVFVHLLDGAGATVRQADAAPGGVRLPTGLWRAGDWVTSTHRLSLDGLPSGDYRLAVGLYTRADQTRLAVWDAAGGRLADDRLLLAPLYVAGRAHRAFLPSVQGGDAAP